MQRRGAGVDRDGERRPAVTREVGLEPLDPFAEDEGPVAHGRYHGLFQVRADRAVLGTEIQERCHDAFLSVPSSTGWPRSAAERLAVVSISTTRNPLSPSDGAGVP